MRPFALLIVAAGLSAPQVAPLDQARDNPPVFRSGADLVRFDVRVDGRIGPPDPRPAPGGARDRRGRRAPADPPLPAHRRARRHVRRSGAALGLGGGVEQPRRAPRPSLPAGLRSGPHRPRQRAGRAARGRDLHQDARPPVRSRRGRSAFPGPDRSWGSPPIARARSPSSRRSTRTWSATSRAPAGTSRCTRRTRSPAATTRSSPTCMVRQSRDLTADVGAAASAGMRASRIAAPAQGSGRAGDHPEADRRERADGGRAGRRLGARFAPAAVRSRRAVPHRRRAKDGRALFRRLPPAQRLARAGAGRGRRGPELLGVLRLRPEPARRHRHRAAADPVDQRRDRSAGADGAARQPRRRDRRRADHRRGVAHRRGARPHRRPGPGLLHRRLHAERRGHGRARASTGASRCA